MKFFDKNDLLFLQKFFSGRLSEKEQKPLKSKLDQIDLQQDKEFYKAFFQAVELEEDRRLKEVLKKEDQPSQAGKKEQKSVLAKLTPTWKWAAAASIMVLFFALYWLFQPHSPAHFEAYPATAQIVDRASTDLNTEQTAFYWYNKGRYFKALQHFSELPISTTISFYQANSLLALNQADQSIALLNQVVVDQESVYAEPAKFYLGYAYFQIGNIQQASYWLNEVIKSEAASEKHKAIAEKMLAAKE